MARKRHAFIMRPGLRKAITVAALLGRLKIVKPWARPKLDLTPKKVGAPTPVSQPLGKVKPPALPGGGRILYPPGSGVGVYIEGIDGALTPYLN